MRTMVKFNVSKKIYSEGPVAYVSPDAVSLVGIFDGITAIYCGNGDRILVDETPEEALAKLGFNNGGGA